MNVKTPTLDTPIQSLSGGMRRRVAIVRALAYNAPMLLMDEPFKGLDDAIKQQVMDVIAKNTQNKLVILITHNVQEALYLADELYLLDGPPLQVRQHITIPEPLDRRNDSEFQQKYYKKVNQTIGG
jgi:NitT/TauT family transport system ATP-binding protein